MRRSKRNSQADLFSVRTEIAERQSRDSRAEALLEAEKILLDIADYVYAHTSLKPISKTLFLISRCLLVAKSGELATSATDLCLKYQAIQESLNSTAPEDDFDFSAVVSECELHLPYVLEAIGRVQELTHELDGLGLAFNTLLRGKFEGGEGLGTFLTPEEVVFPMIDMLLKVVDHDLLRKLGGGKNDLLYGDICGGTGRFVYSVARRLLGLGVSSRRVAEAARLFDQSVMAVDLGKLNFLFEGMHASFGHVNDSLTDLKVDALRERFLLLATNPPFGSGKYRWHPRLADSMDKRILECIGVASPEQNADPSELFFFRNLDLLAAGGVLAIVLPDGIAQSERFHRAICAYERIHSASLQVTAVVSLPAATFALGGTVAKTSFVIVQKGAKGGDRPLYVATANHVGFLKRGNKRANDAKGNDLIQIASEFSTGKLIVGKVVANWKEHGCLASARLIHSATPCENHASQARLGELVETVRVYQNGSASNSDIDSFHVSILDVDATGLIDIVAASCNKPVSKGIACKLGDILLSCLNPKIWRVAVIPNIAGQWSCSPEFLVLRPKRLQDSWPIAIAVHHPSVAQAVQAMAKGTSSSRQRVPKDSVLAVAIPQCHAESIEEHAKLREVVYRTRLREARAYQAVHQGQAGFVF